LNSTFVKQRKINSASTVAMAENFGNQSRYADLISLDGFPPSRSTGTEVGRGRRSTHWRANTVHPWSPCSVRFQQSEAESERMSMRSPLPTIEAQQVDSDVEFRLNRPRGGVVDAMYSVNDIEDDTSVLGYDRNACQYMQCSVGNRHYTGEVDAAMGPPVTVPEVHRGADFGRSHGEVESKSAADFRQRALADQSHDNGGFRAVESIGFRYNDNQLQVVQPAPGMVSCRLSNC